MAAKVDPTPPRPRVYHGRRRINQALYREVDRLLAVGCRRGDMLKMFSTHPDFIDVAPRTLDDYIAMVHRDWEDHTKVEIKHERARVLRTLEHAVQIAFSQKDMKAVVGLVDRQAKIMGLYSAQVLEIHGGVQLETSAESRGALSKALVQFGLDLSLKTGPTPPAASTNGTNGHGTNGATNGAAK